MSITAPFEHGPSQPLPPRMNILMSCASGAGQPAGLIFEHQRSWRTSQLLWGLSVTAMFTPPMLLTCIVGGFETSFFLVVGLLSTLLVFGLAHNIHVTGEWRIQVTQEHVTWEVPRHLHGRQSFRVNISEITMIMSEHISEHSGNSARHYFLVMANGARHSLSHPFSGIDLEGFCSAIQKTGVAYCRHP